MDNNLNLKEQREYAWNYFQLHAEQRMKSFYFFVVIAALFINAIAGSFKEVSRFHFMGALLGFSLAITSFVFWKLDQRVRFLIKHAEDSLKEIEAKGYDQSEKTGGQTINIFLSEEMKTDKIKTLHRILPWKRHMSYSSCFGLLYILFCLVGLFAGFASLIKVFS